MRCLAFRLRWSPTLGEKRGGVSDDPAFRRCRRIPLPCTLPVRVHRVCVCVCVCVCARARVRACVFVPR